MDLLNQVCSNDNEIKPMLKEIHKKNLEINYNLLQPLFNSSRIYNRFWRSTYENNISNGLLSIITQNINTEIKEKKDNDTKDI